MPLSPNSARLPALERDILYLAHEVHRTYSDIARILGLSQPAVNYRYKRARERLAIWDLIPPVTPDEVRAVMQGLGAREIDVSIMSYYVETNSQSEVARRLEISQGFVRHSLMRSIIKHLQNDLSHEDRHVRVRQACSILVNKPGMFNDTSNPTLGHLPANREITRSLLEPPRLDSNPKVGATVKFLSGLYTGLVGHVEEVGERITVKLDLSSQEIRLQWPTGSGV